MDGDIFGAVTRLGRDAATEVARALQGGEWDPFLAERCLEVMLNKAGGVRSLPGVLRELQALDAAPLLASALAESSLQKIDDVVHEPNGTVLDLMLGNAACACVARGEYGPESVLRRFLDRVLDRAIIAPRGGFLELQEGGLSRCAEARALLATVASDAAAILRARPDAKHLGLTRRHARLTADSNLLGGED